MSRVLPFTKMHGAGNDFIMVDGAVWAPALLTAARIAALCDRRRGIGADGLIALAPAAGGEVGMAYYNADGGEAAMCGNGARCAVAFARGLGLAGDACVLRTPAGPVRGAWEPGGEVSVDLTPARGVRLHLDLAPESPFPAHHLADTGVPHLVVPVDDVAAVDVARWGPVLRRHPRLGPAGANVDWVQAGRGGEPHRLRTFERGVEAETLACGTGAAAAALVLCRLGLAASPVPILTRGGDRLTITVTPAAGGDSLRLRGPVAVSFSGEVRIDEGESLDPA